MLKNFNVLLVIFLPMIVWVNILFIECFRFFLGNPGDYVWGRDGLDTIVTELLNQLDGSGPPPLSRSQIDEIPTTSIIQSHIGKYK